MKPRRENGGVFVNPTTSDVSTGSLIRLLLQLSERFPSESLPRT
jgi:hypothetical protein